MAHRVMAPRVIVAGAGIAGVACARALVDAGIDVEVRDRGRVVGGRMASRWIDGRIVDAGASYFTATSPEFAAVVDDWTIRGVVHPWTDRFPILSAAGGLGEPKPGPWRYAAPRGLRSLVADLVSRGGIKVRQQTPVTMIGPGPTVDGEKVDGVVLAMPDPQALRHLDENLTAERAALAGREWEPVLALLAGWDRRLWPHLDGAFVDGDGTIAWIADDGARRGDNAPVLVAHSTPAFARKHLDDPQSAGGSLVDAVRDLLSIADEPTWTYVQRWTFARPVNPHDEPFFLSGNAIGLAGDGWGRPKIETAWQSGDALGRALARRLG